MSVMVLQSKATTPHEPPCTSGELAITKEVAPNFFFFFFFFFLSIYVCTYIHAASGGMSITILRGRAFDDVDLFM